MKQSSSIARTFIIIVTLMILVAVPFSTALADSDGPHNAGTGINVPGIGSEAWQNPDEITSPGSPYAVVTLSRDFRYSNTLQATNYAFNLPSNAIVTGIVVMINRMSSGSSPSIYDYVVSLVKAGENVGQSVIVGDNKASLVQWTKNNFTTASYGGAADLWGTTWTPAEINDPDFGVALAAYRQSMGNFQRDAIVNTMQITVYFTMGGSSTTVNCGNDAPAITYGDSLTCKATVSDSGNLTPTGTVGWTTDGDGTFDDISCNLTEVSLGIASCTVVYTPLEVGNHLITANYSGDAVFDPSSGYQTIMINQKPASVTPDVLSKMYGDSDPTLTGVLDGFLAGDNVTAEYNRETGETVLGGPYAISATLSPVEALANYDITYNTADFSINPRPASVTPNPASKTYGGVDPTLTGTLSGFLSTDGITATYTRTTGESVAGSPYIISASLSPAEVLSNYDVTSNTANFNITQRPITITADAKVKVVGQPDPFLSYSITSGSLAFSDVFTGALSRDPGEAVGSYAIRQGTLAVNANYLLTYVGANLVIANQIIILPIICR